jgi:threonine synthase
MDISKASNFERFVHDLVGRDGQRTAELFGASISRDGGFAVTPGEFARIADFGFVSGSSTHADRLATIRDVWERRHTLIDTHTADGVKVARENLRSGVPMIVLETALPAKFAETIREAVGIEPSRPSVLDGLEDLPRRFVVVPADATAIRQYIEAHA